MSKIYVEEEFISNVKKYCEKIVLENNDKIEWNYSEGLNYVPDESLVLAENIIKETEKIVLIYKEKNNTTNGANSNDKLVYVYNYNKIGNLCTNNITENDVNTLIEEGKDLLPDGSKLYRDKALDFSKKLYDKNSKYVPFTPNYVCKGCKFKKCPKLIASYIIYLEKVNKLEEKLEKRKEFRSKNELNDRFDFTWDTRDLLSKVNNKMFEYSKALVQKNLIDILSVKTKDNLIEIFCGQSCGQVTECAGDISKIDNNSLSSKDMLSLRRNIEKPLYVCDSYKCRLSACPLFVAAAIFYCKEIGREDIIEEARKEYQENKEEKDNEVRKIIREKLEKISEQKNNALEDIYSFKDKVSNINNLVEKISNRNQNNFHIFIECEKTSQANNFIDAIVNSLKAVGKNEEQKSFRMRLSQFAANFSRDLSNRSTSGETRHINMYEYLYTLPNAVYILTDIDEFVADYRNYFSSTGRYELKIKQFSYALDLINDLSLNNYFILVGDKKSIDSFMELDSRLKFTFQDSILKIADISIEEMYREYTKLIKPELINELRRNEERVKEDFIDFVSLNEKFIPFSKEELAHYLANYSNSKNKLVLPNDIYDKQSIDEALADFIGMNQVKEKVKEFEKYMLFNIKAKNLGITLKSQNMHMIFTGNPGTGKTTIARIMAKMLYDLGIIEENKLVEVERKDLIGQYIGQTAPKTAEVIEKAMGGVLFIDEAYTLAPKKGSNDFGAEAIATLIKAMEDHKDKLVVIFAGYRDEMYEFMEINPGISSRIGYKFDFPDYTAEDLYTMFEKKITKMGFELKDVEIQVKTICEYFVKRKDFGNGRFIDRLIQETILNHSQKENINLRVISKDDIPTIEQLTNSVSEKMDVEEMLSNIIGLEQIKQKIRDFGNYISFIKNAKENGINVESQNMHMIFTGNPGTGKTTVARIIAKMLFEMGIVHENKVMEVERKDLVGQYAGETALKTAEVVDKAMGGVLFVDEAYSLAGTKGSNDLGSEAIATLIKAMEDHKGEFVVIFAGYTKEMHDFLNINSGIASRIGYTFEFSDYSKEELFEMFKKKMIKFGFELGDIEFELDEVLGYFVKKKNFGNGRFVDKLIQETIMKHSKNKSDNIKLITKEDIPTIEELNNAVQSNLEVDEVLNSIIGLGEVKKKIKDFENYISFYNEARQRNIELPTQNMHMIFTGNPGTGKTTFARIMAQILYNLGVIHDNKVIEVERKDLIAEYIGQTAPKTSDVIERAMGGVLFIDEAYSLAAGKFIGNDFGSEAIATLIKAMEDHKGEFIVIFAGYKKEMTEFLSMNSGIASRIGYTFDFPDYSKEELTQIFELKVKKSKLELEDKAKEKVYDIMKYFHNVENIGNGRFVDRVFQEVIMRHSYNLANINNNSMELTDERIVTIKEEDIPTIRDITNILMDGDSMIDPSTISEKSIRKTCYHELGHAFLRYKNYSTSGIKLITCAAEGSGALGYVQYEIKNGKYTESKEEMLGIIRELLAGMGAEDVFCGHYESGNSSDLSRATNIAKNMVTRYGMSDLGLGVIEKPSGELEYEVQKEINSILDKCFKETKKILVDNKDIIEIAFDRLYSKKELTGEEIEKIFSKAEENKAVKKEVSKKNIDKK